MKRPRVSGGGVSHRERGRHGTASNRDSRNMTFFEGEWGVEVPMRVAQGVKHKVEVLGDVIEEKAFEEDVVVVLLMAGLIKKMKATLMRV